MDADPFIVHESQPTRTIAARARAAADKATTFQGSQFFYDPVGSKY